MSIPLRSNILAMRGYTPGEQPLDPSLFIKLNTNENPYPPSPQVFESLAKITADNLRKYPDPIATIFRQTAANLFDVSPDWITACNGSDDALTILARAAVPEAGLLVAPTPSYPLYSVLAHIQGCRYEERPFNSDWRLPNDFTTGANLAFIPNPNSPTGTFIPPDELLELAKSSACLIVADEAYADFAADNCASRVRHCERLVVTRSFSKSYALAGLRFGFVIAQPTVTRELLKVKDSYNCDAISIALATAALLDQDHFKESTRKIKATRKRLELSLAELGFDVTPSHANFVWCRRSKPVEPIYKELKERKILVRYLNYANYGDGLRISVGTDEEINTLLDGLREIV